MHGSLCVGLREKWVNSNNVERCIFASDPDMVKLRLL